MMVAVLTAGVFSCDTDRLNPIPKTVFSDKVVFDTPERVALQVNGLYSSFKNGQLFGGRAQIYGDIRANDFINRTNNGVTGLLVWNHSVTEASQNDVVALWTQAYQTINQINVFIDGMEESKGKFESLPFTETFKTTTSVQYIAEARYLRAVVYHTLLQFYAKPWAAGAGAKPGLPLRLKGNKDSNDNELARSTVDQVYTQIIADLDFAEANLPLTYASQDLNTTRAHRNTAIAFKTRVYLTKTDYAKVKTEAAKLVPVAPPFTASSGVPQALNASATAAFTGAQTTLETVLSMPFTAQNGPGGQSQLGAYYRGPGPGANPGVGEFTLNTSPGSIVANTTEWLPGDTRRSFIYTVASDSYWGKYPSGTPFLDRAPIQRWSEVLLNYAEAIARTSATPTADPQALALLNAVRTRAAGAGNPWAPADNATLIANILTERRIEFLGEGLRNQDIMRLEQSFPPKGTVPAVGPGHIVWVWPIPDRERFTNPALVQNAPND